MAVLLKQVFWLRPTVRGRSCVNAPASPPTAGTTINPESWLRSVTSAIIRAAPRSIFLPAGPFAILPLSGKRSSLVWTEKRAEAARIVALGEQEFHGELERRFGLHLGEVKALDRPRAFPLGYFVARSFIGERLALVGDAAHVIHPIAGQGLNMGLKDVAALAEVVVDT